MIPTQKHKLVDNAKIHNSPSGQQGTKNKKGK
jgi:hypothetical protein